jgi:hypothetical protein
MDTEVESCLTIAKDDVPVGTRPELNLIEGAGITLTVVDDPDNNRVNARVDNRILPIGADGYIQYYDQGILAGNTNFVFSLQLPNPTGIPYPGFIIGTEPAKGGAITTDASLTNGVELVISAGEANTGDFTGGNLLLFAGSADAGVAGTARLQGGTSVSAKAGDVILAGGNSSATGSAGWAFLQGGLPGANGDGGHVKLIATQRSGSSLQNGWIFLNAGGADKLIIIDTGAWFIDGAYAGAAGDVLSSSGSSASPAWKPLSLGSEGTVTLEPGINNDVEVGAHSRILMDSSAGPAIVTGFTAAVDGKLLLITNGRSSNAVSLATESDESAAANRIFAEADTVLAPAGSRMLCYSGTLARWVLTT